MKHFLKQRWKFYKEVRALSKIMPFRDAWNLERNYQGSGTARAFLYPSQRHISLRLGTSDFDCLKQVFLNGEYDTPFKISPKFIVDAGANVGMATLFLAAKFPGAQIFSLEPEASNFKMLQQNCSGLPNVTLLQAALWPSSGTVFIQDTGADKWSFTVTNSQNQQHSSGGLPAVSLPELMAKAGSNQIDYLKLDIEGAELELFSESTESWLNNVGVIAIELHDKFRKGCAQAFYSAISKRPFIQEIRSENIFIQFQDGAI
jgi:FkbM family methyltransferase